MFAGKGYDARRRASRISRDVLLFIFATMQPAILHFLNLGRIPYDEGLRVMREVMDARRDGRVGDTLLFMEHPPVLTLGRNATRAHVVASSDLLARRGVTLHETNRGGDITYHGPGQLVGYPVFDLRGDWPGKDGEGGTKKHLGPVDFVRLMEEALIFTCKDFGIPARRVCGRTGVWTYAGGSVLEKKIAAIGIHVSRGITSHGFALNVATDLRDFELIVPCGIADRTVTSVEEEMPAPGGGAESRPGGELGGKSVWQGLRKAGGGGRGTE